MKRLGTALTLCLLVGAALTSLFGATASASPGALGILIDESQCNAGNPPLRLGGQILANPGVAAVDYFNGALGTPTAAGLAPYDAVVAIGDCNWSDAKATGNVLAEYEDAGGAVIGTTFVWQEVEGGYTLEGRWIDAGYSPYQVGAESAFEFVGLGSADTSNPLLAGVGPLSAYYRDEVAPTPGASQLATWSDGTSAIAVKGHALGINAYLGAHYGEPSVETEPGETVWQGNYGRLIVNFANFIHPVLPSPAPVAAPVQCEVPKLKGKTVRAARRALRAAHCKLGTVSRPKGVKSRRVKRQSPKPGAVRGDGAKVNVRLKPIRPKPRSRS